MPCLSEITTPSGTFVIHNEKVSRSKAEKICQREGSILAPIANQADKNAIFKLTGPNKCPTYQNWPEYWVGLEVTPSCTDKKKTFSNGIQWNDELHSHLYSDQTTSEYALALAEFVPGFRSRGLRIVDSANDNYCDGYKQNFICLKEAKKPARSRELVQAEKESVLGSRLSYFSFLVNFVLVTFFIVLFVQKHYRKKTMLDL